MVNAGLLPATVADEGLADFVARIFDNIVVHKDLAVSGPNSIAWAFRKDSSQLAAAVNGFVAQAHKGTRRSEEHTSELQSLLRNSYDVFFLQKTNQEQHANHTHP